MYRQRTSICQVLHHPKKTVASNHEWVIVFACTERNLPLPALTWHIPPQQGRCLLSTLHEGTHPFNSLSDYHRRNMLILGIHASPHLHFVLATSKVGPRNIGIHVMIVYTPWHGHYCFRSASSLTNTSFLLTPDSLFQMCSKLSPSFHDSAPVPSCAPVVHGLLPHLGLTRCQKERNSLSVSFPG